MGRRLYVGNLAWTVTDQDLQDAFSEAGKVENSQVIMDRATNRSRGFGFVEMATDEGADAAINRLNGREIKGRPIRVNEAQARGGGGGGGSRPSFRTRPLNLIRPNSIERLSYFADQVSAGHLGTRCLPIVHLNSSYLKYRARRLAPPDPRQPGKGGANPS